MGRVACLGPGGGRTFLSALEVSLAALSSAAFIRRASFSRFSSFLRRSSLSNSFCRASFSRLASRPFFECVVESEALLEESPLRPGEGRKRSLDLDLLELGRGLLGAEGASDVA